MSSKNERGWAVLGAYMSFTSPKTPVLCHKPIPLGPVSLYFSPTINTPSKSPLKIPPQPALHFPQSPVFSQQQTDGHYQNATDGGAEADDQALLQHGEKAAPPLRRLSRAPFGRPQRTLRGVRGRKSKQIHRPHHISESSSVSNLAPTSR